MQGRFEAFHDHLFAYQDSIGLRPWPAFALSASVPDTTAFLRCLEEPQHSKRVAADADLAQRLKLPGTPAMIVEGTLLPGNSLVTELDEYVRKSIEEKVGRNPASLSP